MQHFISQKGTLHNVMLWAVPCCWWVMFQLPGKKSSSETSEKCLSVVLFVETERLQGLWNTYRQCYISNYIAEHRSLKLTKHRYESDSAQCLDYTNSITHSRQFLLLAISFSLSFSPIYKAMNYWSCTEKLQFDHS